MAHKNLFPVNNAAVGHFGSILTASREDIVNVFNIDVFGPIQLVQTVVPHMPKGGRIINIGSIASKLGIADIPVYGAAKAAMDTLTFSMSKEVSPLLDPALPLWLGMAHGINFLNDSSDLRKVLQSTPSLLAPLIRMASQLMPLSCSHFSPSWCL